MKRKRKTLRDFAVEWSRKDQHAAFKITDCPRDCECWVENDVQAWLAGYRAARRRDSLFRGY